jgi:MATE family multidrug resistance protein
VPLLSGKHDREILSLAVPALGALAADPLVSLVDTAFVGRLGTVPLGALGVNTSIFSLTFVVFNFLAYGITPMIGRAVGRGDRDEAAAITIQAFVLAIALGTSVLLAIQLFAPLLLRLMGAGTVLRRDAMTYLRIRAFAGPAVLLVTAGHGVFRGYQDTRIPFYVTLALNVVNLVLDPILIFALGWGVAGAALATVIAQWSGALAFVVVLARRHRSAGISFRLPPLRDFAPIIRVGWELSVRTLALVGSMTLATAVATRIGVVAVAAHQVGNQLRFFFSQAVDCLAITAQALVAKHQGAGRPQAAREVSDRVLLWGLVFGVLLAAAFILLQRPLIRIFTEEAEVIAAVRLIFPFLYLLQPLGSLVFVWDGIYMGAGYFRYLALAMLASAAASAVVTLLALPMGWGLAGVWWGFVTLMAVRALTLGIRYFSGRRSPVPRVG